ncbi:hypothetical protein [Halobiforma nitratireducens]|uniref:Uncharacterized protein n=1 Tax=Halobiforma nitratireducens JCM 10879 TaxID=1227454 RepID=M0LCY8_9EURY|nr:hypothetical protein [Halobiforma nitratireducens]EMA31441.1 hypothetical protein C446_15778 [Halobiforma nitratireducens JCM 10879]
MVDVDRLVDKALYQYEYFLHLENKHVVEEGVFCKLCGQDEFETEESTETVEVEVCRSTCRIPGCNERHDTIRVSLVPDEDSNVFVRYLEYECPEHPDHHIPPFVDERPTATIEREVDVEVIISNLMHRHHVSYEPEELIWVCPTCHAQIHHTEQYKEYKPDMTRQEWLDSQ